VGGQGERAHRGSRRKIGFLRTRIIKTWNVPGDATRDRVLLDLAGQVLSNGKSSRLYKRLIYDDQTATRVRAYNDTREIASLFTIETDVKKEVEPAKAEARDGRGAGQVPGERSDGGRA
jgi:zinc protease